MVLEVSNIIVDLPAGKQAEMRLCLGDITDIDPKTESHDVIMISSFAADYSAIPSTLIGALKSRFDLSVRDLAQNKAEDLRKNFNCWISKPLPEKLPYRRLLCFEQQVLSRRTRSPEKAVSDIFRAMFTVFADNMSVISPLLATGCQRAGKSRIMHALVTAWHTWVTIGLPMSRYTLVIYTSKLNVDSLSQDDQKAVSEFQRLKTAFEKKRSKAAPVPIDNDLIVICCEPDIQVLERTVRSLKSSLPSLRCRKVVHSDDSSSSSGDDAPGDAAADGKSASDAMEARRSQMLSSRLVVCMLTQAFLGTRACVEDFNVAMCLGHTSQHPFLPVCLERLASPPTYMSLIQWADCRAKPGDPPMTEKLDVAIKEIAGRLGQLRIADESTDPNGPSASQASGPAAKSMKNPNCGYDIFISYSHRDSAEVTPFLTELQNSCPKLRVFFDKEGIQTGFSWMETIYSAVSRSRLIIAFLTPDYIKSPVCAEEFAIGSLLHRSDHFQCMLLPICLKAVSAAPPVFQCLERWIDATKLRDQATKRLGAAVAKLMGPTAGDKKSVHLKEQLFPDCGTLTNLDKRLDKLRLSLLKPSDMPNQKAVDAFKTALAGQNLPIVDICHVALVCHPDDREPIVESVGKQLLAFLPELQLRILDSDKSHDDLEAIEHAGAVALFLSPVFLTSARLTSLLYLTLCRKRSQSAPVLLFCLNPLPKHPAFYCLLPINASIEDVKPFAEMYAANRKAIDSCLSDASRNQFNKLPPAECAFAFCCAKAILERRFRISETFSTTASLLASLFEVESGRYLSDPSVAAAWPHKLEPL